MSAILMFLAVYHFLEGNYITTFVLVLAACTGEFK